MATENSGRHSVDKVGENIPLFVAFFGDQLFVSKSENSRRIRSERELL